MPLRSGFSDPDAKILYVPAEEVFAVARVEGAIPFDVADLELGHHGSEYTFAAISWRRYGRQRSRTGMPRARSNRRRFRLTYDNDQALEHELPVYDALYAYFQKLVARERNKTESPSY